MGVVRAPVGGTTQPAIGWWRRVASDGRSSVGARVALGSVLGAAAALGIAASLSLGAGPRVRLPPAVVLPSNPPDSGVTTQLHDATPTSTATPVSPSGDGFGVPGDVTVVMPTPDVVVQPAESAAGTDTQGRAGATSDLGGGDQHASTSSSPEQSSSTATSSTATSSTATSSIGSANAPSSTTPPLAPAGGGDTGSGGGAPDH